MYIKKMILASTVLATIAQAGMATEATLEAFSQTTTQETTTQTTTPVVETAVPVSTESYKETAEYQKDGSSTQAKYEYDKKVDQSSNGETKVTTQESVTIKDEQK